MGFGFAPADQMQLPAPAMDPSLALNMPAPVAAPAPMAAPVQALQPQAQPFKPSLWSILQGVIFDGQSPDEASMAARQRDYQQHTMQLMAKTLQNASPAELKAILTNPGKYGEEFAKNFAPVTTAEGATETMFGGPGAGGSRFTAPKTVFDEKSGKSLTILPGMQAENGPSTGGDYSVNANGAEVSGRLGLTGRGISLPQIMAPGSTGTSFTPTVSGPGGPAQAPAAAAAAAAPASASSAPRGIRNNNFGNLRALPSGHAWAGQTGVDPDGYAVFGSPVDGLKAAAQNLNSYAAQGINTLAGLTKRWAPASDRNDPTAYAHYLAGKLGVGTTDKIDLTDPATQKTVLHGISDFENGPAAMSAWKGKLPAGARQKSAPAAAGGFGQPFAQGKEPQPMTTADRQRWNIPTSDSRTWMIGPDGKPAVVADSQYGPKDVREQRSGFFNSDEYKEYNNAATAANNLEGLLHSFTKNNSVLDQAALDNGIRTMTGLSARNQNVVNFTEHLGLPDKLTGMITQKFGNGYLTPDVLMGIRTMIRGYAQGHLPAVQQRLQNESDFAKSNGQEFSASITPISPQQNVAWLDGKGQKQGMPSNPLTVGQVVQGRPYLGGDPHSPKSWGPRQ